MDRGRVRAKIVEIEDLSEGLKDIFFAASSLGSVRLTFNGYLSDIWPTLYTYLMEDIWYGLDSESIRGGKTIVFQGCPGIGKTHAVANLLAVLVATGGKDYAGYKWDKVFYLAPTHKLLSKMGGLVEKEFRRLGVRVKKPLLLYNSPANCRINWRLVRRAYKLLGYHAAFCRYCIEEMVDRLLGGGGGKGKRGRGSRCGSLTGTCLGDYVVLVGQQAKEHALRENKPVIGPEYNIGVYPVCLRKLVSVMLTWLWQRSSKKSSIGRKVQMWYLGALLPYQTIITPHVMRTWLVGERKDAAWLFIFDEADTIIARPTPIVIDVESLDPTEIDREAMDKIGVTDTQLKRLKAALKKLAGGPRLISTVSKSDLEIIAKEILPTVKEMKVDLLLKIINRLAFEKDKESNLYKPLLALQTMLEDPFLYERQALITSTGKKIVYYTPFLTMEMLFNTELPTKASTKMLLSATFAANVSLLDFMRVKPKLIGHTVGGEKIRAVVALAEYRYEGLITIYHDLYSLGVSIAKGDIMKNNQYQQNLNYEMPSAQEGLPGYGFPSIHTALIVGAAAAIVGLVYFASFLSRLRGGTGNAILWFNSKQDTTMFVSILDQRFGDKLCTYEESTRDYYLLKCKAKGIGEFKLLASWYRGRLARGLDISAEGYTVSIALGFANPTPLDRVWDNLLRYSSSAEMLQAVFRVVRNPRLEGVVIALPFELRKAFDARGQPYDFNFIFERTIEVRAPDCIRFLLEVADGVDVDDLTPAERYALDRGAKDLYKLLEFEKVTGWGGET